jgi:hypothetical protein
MSETGFIKKIKTTITDQNLTNIVNDFNEEWEGKKQEFTWATGEMFYRISVYNYLLKRYEKLYTFIHNHPEKNELLRSPKVSEFYNDYNERIIEASIDRRKHP